MRLSDILKKKFGQPPGKELSKEPPKESFKEESPQKTEPFAAPPLPVQISKAMARKAELQDEPGDLSEQKPREMQFVKAMKQIEVNKEEFANLYADGIQLSRDVLKSAKEIGALDLNTAKNWVAKIVDYFLLGDKELQSHFYEQDDEFYMYRHMVNAVIMAVPLGLSLGYNKSRLTELGLAAFLYDIGMIKVRDIVSQPKALSGEEVRQMREHVVHGIAILSQIKDMPEKVLLASKEHHERMFGKGYPVCVKNGAISEYARIIGLVDVYEALTHRRSYRQENSPHEVIREIVTELYSLFDLSILRILVNQVGIYPIGSWVQLNTKEIGKVITSNEELPLRPVIKLLFDSMGNRFAEPKVINLAKQANLYIKGPLCDKDIVSHIKKCY